MIILTLWQVFASAFVGAVVGAVGMREFLLRRTSRNRLAAAHAARDAGLGVWTDRLDLDPAREQAVPVTEVGWTERVRPAHWHGYHATLAVEPVDSEFVKVLWRMDGPDSPPEPFTVFRRDEMVAVATL